VAILILLLVAKLEVIGGIEELGEVVVSVITDTGRLPAKGGDALLFTRRFVGESEEEVEEITLFTVDVDASLSSHDDLGLAFSSSRTPSTRD
jgi:hypothetical protein